MTTQSEVSGWAVGWTAFAGVVMILMGFWWGLMGLIALINDEFYVKTPEYIFQFDVTTWGWIHIILGIVIFLAGLALFSGAVWARFVGVILAGLAGLAAFAWLPWAPVWASILIFVSISVIWALTVHGRDIAVDKY